MNDTKSNANPGLSDVRGISDPPDMGRLKPAWKAAEDQLRHGLIGKLVDTGRLVEAEEALADIIRQSRAEGAAAALVALNDIADFCEQSADEQEEMAADAWPHEAASERRAGKAEAYRNVIGVLRARAKGISDPPDMG